MTCMLYYAVCCMCVYSEKDRHGSAMFIPGVFRVQLSPLENQLLPPKQLRQLLGLCRCEIWIHKSISLWINPFFLSQKWGIQAWAVCNADCHVCRAGRSRITSPWKIVVGVHESVHIPQQSVQDRLFQQQHANFGLPLFN